MIFYEKKKNSLTRNQGIKEKVLEKRITTSLLYPTIETDGSKAMYSAGSDITPWSIASHLIISHEQKELNNFVVKNGNNVSMDLFGNSDPN